ncbi:MULTISPECIES: DedA family protein [Thermoanaerobacterium]|uniref:VTT domain-containing protein n=2 Tax=Thermoanaerobacterium TaxID=28895 RepID=W9EC93_9THEO|nr:MULTISPECIES: DedA family protein [Thermoanaerobacterium]AFK87383.1 SNARE associated protein [Thermoanaerobacterium saccharolyticum JW/SL-YS485]ETO38846.1 hypothetical protein V518_0991 [Thermoanaerobacterium aotearoense SCUT27]
MPKNFIFTLLKQYGDPILFLSLAAEYLGMPFVPGETVMAFMGFLELKSSILPIIYSILFATAGTFTGSMVAWFIAFKYGEGVVLKFGITKEKIHKTKISFDKHREVLIIFSKFIPGIRHIIPYLSGIYMIKVKNYALLNFIGSVLWCITFIGLGLLLGEKWQIAVDLIKKYSLALLLLIVILFMLIKFFRKLLR